MSTWVLLRGLVRESRHWGAFVPTLAQALPGNGALHGQRSPACIADMVEACRTQLQVQGLPAPYHLCAVSMGAMVAVQWAHRYPQWVVQAVQAWMAGL